MRKTRHDVVHEFEMTDGELPDLRDSSEKRRRVVRPRRVRIYQRPGSNLVRGAVVEGPQIRRDGQINQHTGWVQVLTGHHSYYDAEPPAWLNELLECEGLVWLTDHETPVP